MNPNKKISFGKINTNFLKKKEETSPDEKTEPESTGVGFGTFGKTTKNVENNAIREITAEDEEESNNMKKIMGLSEFGKKAKVYDVEEMIKKIKTNVIDSDKKVNNVCLLHFIFECQFFKHSHLFICNF